MLSELWDFWTTKSSDEARRDGHLYHAIALAHRARRCQQHWQPHLESCHELINKIPKGDSLTIFGSGLLLETPLNILVKKYNTINLIDAVHTKEARFKVKKITDSLLAAGKNIQIQMVELDLNKEFYKVKSDYFISANILSQIGFVSAQKWLKQGMTDNEIEKKTANLQLKHLEQLKMTSEKGLLFSDYKMQILDLQNQLVEEKPTVAEELKLVWQKQWDWNLAPAPELSKDYSVRLVVGNIQF
jgi:hypothetical protein